jgi:hypothetical protein
MFLGTKNIGGAFAPFASPKLRLWITKTYFVNTAGQSRAGQNRTEPNGMECSMNRTTQF